MQHWELRKRSDNPHPSDRYHWQVNLWKEGTAYGAPGRQVIVSNSNFETYEQARAFFVKMIKQNAECS